MTCEIIWKHRLIRRVRCSIADTPKCDGVKCQHLSELSVTDLKSGIRKIKHLKNVYL